MSLTLATNFAVSAGLNSKVGIGSEWDYDGDENSQNTTGFFLNSGFAAEETFYSYGGYYEGRFSRETREDDNSLDYGSLLGQSFYLIRTKTNRASLEFKHRANYVERTYTSVDSLSTRSTVNFIQASPSFVITRSRTALTDLRFSIGTNYVTEDQKTTREGTTKSGTARTLFNFSALTNLLFRANSTEYTNENSDSRSLVNSLSSTLNNDTKFLISSITLGFSEGTNFEDSSEVSSEESFISRLSLRTAGEEVGIGFGASQEISNTALEFENATDDEDVARIEGAYLNQSVSLSAFHNNLCRRCSASIGISGQEYSDLDNNTSVSDTSVNITFDYLIALSTTLKSEAEISNNYNSGAFKDLAFQDVKFSLKSTTFLSRESEVSLGYEHAYLETDNTISDLKNSYLIEYSYNF